MQDTKRSSPGMSRQGVVSTNPSNLCSSAPTAAGESRVAPLNHAPPLPGGGEPGHRCPPLFDDSRTPEPYSLKSGHDGMTGLAVGGRPQGLPAGARLALPIARVSCLT